MKVIANATPLIALALIERLDLLRQMFGTITIAPAASRGAAALRAYLAVIGR